MKLGLENKVAIVTGGSRGIGKAIAKSLCNNGCKVVVCARGENDLFKTVNELKTYGSVIKGITADVTNVNDIKNLVNETISFFGRIDILVNNGGGLNKSSTFYELDDKDWIDNYLLNVLSVVRFVREVLPYMRSQKWGRIINISSESGVQSDAFMPHYNSSKAALLALTKSLSKEYAKDGILINAVSPAFIKSPLVKNMLNEDALKSHSNIKKEEKKFLKTHRPNLVLERAGEPEEVAGIVTFLASTESSFITGADYRVDGGSVATIN